VSTFDLELPDGRILRDIPEGTTKAQILEKLAKNPSPEMPSAEQSPFAPLQEAARVAGTRFYEGATALPRLLATLSEPLEGIKKKFIPGYADAVAGVEQAIGSADKTIKGVLAPETRGGQALGRIGGATGRGNAQSWHAH